MREILTFILAGGKGERLNPLTRDRAKPAVPFGGNYRIIDFTLSNCINSGLRRIFVLIQYKSFSLQRHILSGWNVVSSQLGEFIDLIPPQQRISAEWYRGTADAIYQNLYAIYDDNPELVLILSGDHIYKMDYQKLIEHHQKMDADVTVSCVEMDKKTAESFGVIVVDENGCVCDFQEKPKDPKAIPGNPNKIFASMGIYLFKRDVLVEELEADAKQGSAHDFGKDIIPQMVEKGKRVFVYNFVNEVGQSKYWRDIGTRDAYYQANMDLLEKEPPFELYDKLWPVRTYHAQSPPIKMINASGDRRRRAGSIVDSLVCGGCIIRGARIEHSVVSPNVIFDDYANVSHSVLMEGVVVGKKARIKNAIIDKEVVIPPGLEIGYDEELDKKRFDVTASGIVIVAKKASLK